MNDMASINIDAKLIRNDPKAKVRSKWVVALGDSCMRMYRLKILLRLSH